MTTTTRAPEQGSLTSCCTRACIGGDDEVHFATRREAEQYVATALGSEVDPDEYDIAAITDEVFAWDPATDSGGVQHLNRQGLRLVETSFVGFWKACKRHERMSA